MDGPLLPDSPHETMTNPPVKVMLGQIHYPTIARLYEGPGAVADFQTAIAAEFPSLEVQQVAMLNLGPFAPQPDAPSTQPAPQFAYRFTSKDQNWTLQLTAENLTLEAGPGGEYTSFDDFARLFPIAMGAFSTEFAPTFVTRQGLRYVDHIEDDRSPADWSRTIKPSLLGPLADENLARGLRTSLSELRYPGDQEELIVRHGIAEAGPENKLGYLLDFDSICTSVQDPIDVDGIMGRFSESHDLIYNFFRWCLTDEAIKEFGG